MCLMKMNKLGLLMFATVFSPALGLASDFSSYKNALQILVEPEPRPSVGLVASGFGASGNSFFAAASYTDRDEQTDGNDDDGSIIVGAGFGDPIDAVGVEVSLGLTSVSTSLWGDGKFADEGNVNLKIHKQYRPIGTFPVVSVSVGVSNLTGWGGTLDNPANTYLAASGISSLGGLGQYGVMYTLGYGSAVSDGETSGDLFGGIGVARGDFSASGSFIGDQINLSANWFPSFFNGAVFSYSRSDITNTSGLSRNIFSVGYSF